MNQSLFIVWRESVEALLVIGILQGNRLDWFESSLICWLLGAGVVLLVLLFQGGGRFASLDHWLARWWRPAQCPQRPAG